ncbi:MAG: hypothetical protein R3326_00980 [Gemmatimonadota bacterium]|nr:hypothetical protein [Gemmatimonadota bacterium]
MAEPIVIIKENPGKLRVEVWQDDRMIAGHTFADVAFSVQSDDLSSDRPLFSEKFARKKNGRHGVHYEIRIHRPG